MINKKRLEKGLFSPSLVTEKYHKRGFFTKEVRNRLENVVDDRNEITPIAVSDTFLIRNRMRSLPFCVSFQT